ncbi:carbohydrate-binding protein SusD [Niastella yeongjuensis]|uniref:Carbohydrate-binding protein SusD n=1 Tax=Niastella yeongjuensis TaxID=354355 RepID=A0A1V9FBX5_9BACT|nr:RagB/SusD family nutrient uptake outer membrane protein [Niastella yeongjuensis]OQP55875.1 carbohydrate-binding protein SusD [Niastella yeongjuensis]SEP47201.1 Starch-binding associating with outer membrane [Niastella yeongjuensis]
MKTKIILSILFVTAIITSCKKSFLELAPVSNSNANNFYKTKSDFDLAVNNAYSTLYTMYGPTGLVSYCGELMSDNATLYTVAGSGSITVGDRWAFRDYTLNSANNVVNQLWSDSYVSLYNLNIVLEKITDAALDEGYKTQVTAEMRFLRGMYYFYMVQAWGDVPLVTKPITSGEAFTTGRTPKADVYNQVLEDLKYAADNLTAPDKVPAPGRASNAAALTLLGKVYLTMGNKSLAAQTLQQVYSSYNASTYDLLPEFGSLWGATLAQKNTKESIFEIQYKGGANNPSSTYWPAFAPFENFAITRFGGGMNQVTDDLYNEYEAGDKRRDTSFELGYFKGANWIAIKFQKKWKDANAPIVNAAESCNNNFMIMRYADVLLMLTEATGDVQYMNRVRARAGLPLYGTAGYPAAQYPTLDLAIEHERRMEFAMEFHRWFDLKRTGRAIPVLTAKGKLVNANKLLLPIPQFARDQNPDLGQNDGY